MKSYKIFYIFSLFALLAFSAGAQAQTYTIKGSVALPELEGKKVYLICGENLFSKTPKMDSTVIAKGKYTFKGVVKEPYYYNIYINPADRENVVYAVFVLENRDFTIHTDKNRNTLVSVSGSEYNDVFNKYTAEKEALRKRMYSAFNTLDEAKKSGKITPELEKSLSGDIEKSRDELAKFTFDFVKNNINNPGAWSELHNTALSLSVEEQKELIAGATGRTLTIPEYSAIKERISTLEKTAVGQPFVDFKMFDVNEKDVSLSDFAGKGKYLLIDFWASWCGPCRAEMPALLATYAKYKDQGFEVVGVSLDGKKDSWLKSINTLKLPWPQMSDLKGWECEGAKLYGVTGIPHTVLLDRNGIIIARGLRGEDLDKKLEELVKECGNKTAGSFELKGRLTNYPKKVIYLIKGDLMGASAIDSCEVKEGTFLFKGRLSEPTQAILSDMSLSMNNVSEAKFISFFIEQANMEFNAEWPKEMSMEKMPEYTLTGSLTDKDSKEYSQLTTSDMVKTQESNRKITVDFIKSHPDSYFSASILNTYSSFFSLEDIEILYAALSEKAKGFSVSKEIKETINIIKAVQPGKPAYDFTATDINGKQIKLSDYRGKTVLIDFWASWCKPCRAGMPHVKALYDKYHNKGLEVICIADNDSQLDAWKKAIETDDTGMFIHILRGLKILDNGAFDRSQDISDKYVVHSIPSKFIVNANGILECVKAEEPELDAKLKEIFGF